MISTLPRPSALRAFLAGEAVGGLLLIGAAACALLLVNSGAEGAHLYHAAMHMPLGPTSALHIINDGLMALFFLAVGLEIKREWLDGRLSSWNRRMLPAIAASGGMAVPAIVYIALAGAEPGLARGWAIPAATDIAFALGVLALLGRRAPTALKLLLATIAIVDDIGAVIIIGFFYVETVNGAAIASAAGIFVLMLLLNRNKVTALPVYMALGLALWAAIWMSGIHATVAGVLTAMTIPIRQTPGTPDAADSPLHRLEHALHPWSAYCIVPIFGFANAGVDLRDAGLDGLLSPLPIAIAAGLLIGKQAGIFGSIWLCVRSGLAPMPRGVTWVQIYGLSLLCGIGFTMSLFIGALAFPASPELIEDAKIGILTGSVLSALAGYTVLRLAPQHPDHAAIEAALDREIEADGDVAA